MKRHIIPIFVAVAALAGCQSTELTDPDYKYAGFDTFSATIAQTGNCDTKLSINNTGLSLYWESGDEILVYNGTETLSCNTTQNGSNATFYANKTIEGNTFTAYYGLGDNGTVLASSYSNYTSGDVKHLPLYASSNTRTLPFNCPTAILKVCTYNVNSVNVDKITVASTSSVAGVGSVNAGGAFEVSSSPATSITMTTSGTDASKVFYVPVAAGSHTFTITSYNGETVVDQMVTNSVAVTRNTVYTVYLGKVVHVSTSGVAASAGATHGATLEDNNEETIATFASNVCTLSIDGNYTVVVDENMTALEVTSNSNGSIYLDGTNKAIDALTITAPHSHVEIEKGESFTVNSITSANTLVVKPTYKIKTKATVQAGSITVEGDPAATVASQDANVKEISIEPKDAESPIVVSVINDAKVDKITNAAANASSATINVTDVAYVEDVINSSTSNTTSVDITVRKEGQIGTVTNNDATSEDKKLTVNEEGGTVHNYVGYVDKKTILATVGDAQYESYDAAIAAAASGETITLISDIDLTGTYARDVAHEYKLADNVTIDLAGHTVTSYNYSVVYRGNGLVIKDGNLVVVPAPGNADDVAKNMGSYALFIGFDSNTRYTGVSVENVACTGGINVNNAQVTISNSESCKVLAQKYYAVWADKDADITIASGKFVHSSVNPTYPVISTGDEGGDEHGSITVLGGLFSKTFDEAFVPSGYQIVPAQGDFYTVKPVTPVAKIGSVTFASLADAIAAVPANGAKTVVTMMEDDNIVFDTNIYVTIEKEKNVVLDLNGHKILSATSYVGGSQLIYNVGTLTVKDSQTGGTIEHGADSAWIYDGSGSYEGIYVSNLITNYGKLYLEGGTLKNVTNGSASYVTDSFDSSEIYVTGGQYSAKHSAFRLFSGTVKMTVSGGSISAGGYDIAQFAGGGSSNHLVISGGEFTTTGSFNVYSWGETAGNTSSLKISGGTFDKWVAISSSFCQTGNEISGGKFYAVWNYNDNPGKFVSGGIYQGEPAAEFVKDGYTVVDNTDPETKETYPYKVTAVEVKVGETYYATLADAIDAVESGETIQLVSDIDYGEFSDWQAITVAEGKNFTLDLAGKTIRGTATRSGESKLILVQKGATLTVKDSGSNGAITYNSTQPDPGWWYGTYTIDNQGTFNLESGSVINTTEGGASYAVENHSNHTSVDVVFNMSGGALRCDNGDQALRLYGNNNTGKCRVNITGGTIVSGGIWTNDQTASSTGGRIELNISGTPSIAGMLDFVGSHDNTVINISGGTFTCPKLRLRDSQSYANTKPYANVSGGDWTITTIENKNTDGAKTNTMSITGGTFNSDMDGFVADGYEAVSQGGDPETWKVQ